MEANAFWIRLAGVVIEVRDVCEECRIQCRNFQVAPLPGITPDLVIRLRPEDLAREAELLRAQEDREGRQTGRA